MKPFVFFKGQDSKNLIYSDDTQIPFGCHVVGIGPILYNPYTFYCSRRLFYENDDGTITGILNIGENHELWNWTNIS